MPKDWPQEMRLDDLTDEEIERIEADAFCAGGPPETLTKRMILHASLSKAPPVRGVRRYV